MGFKSFVGGLGKWLFGKAKNFFDRNREDILKDLENLAKTAVLSVPKLISLADRQTAVDEIIRVARGTGTEWGSKLLTYAEGDIRTALSEHYTESDLKRYLGLARLTTSLLEKTSLDKLPSTHTLLGLVQAALMDIAGE